MQLTNPHVTLAAHQSSVDFIVEAPISHPARVHARIDALHEQGHPSNVFRVVSGAVNDCEVLEWENEFEGELVLRTEPQVVQDPEVMRLALGLVFALGLELSERDFPLDLSWSTRRP